MAHEFGFFKIGALVMAVLAVAGAPAITFHQRHPTKQRWHHPCHFIEQALLQLADGGRPLNISFLREAVRSHDVQRRHAVRDPWHQINLVGHPGVADANLKPKQAILQALGQRLDRIHDHGLCVVAHARIIGLGAHGKAGSTPKERYQ